MTEPTNPDAAQAPLPESTDLFDYALVRAWLGFGLGSLRRHWLRALVACLIPLTTAIVALTVLPKTYHTETTMMAERNQVLPALSNTFVSLFKDTSVASVLAVPELTYGAQWINFNTFRIVEVYAIVTPMYLVAGYCILGALRLLERRFAVR